MRNLSMIWKDDKAINEGFSEKNTLLIDSEAFKVRKCADNSIVLKPYTLDEVMGKVVADNLSILGQCKDYVIKMLDEAEDVQ